MLLRYCVLTLVALVEMSSGDARSDQDMISKMLRSERYDWRVRPPGTDTINGPVRVAVNMMLRSISKIDDVNMEYSVQMTFREEWLDTRLAYGVDGDPHGETVYDGNAVHTKYPDFVILPTEQNKIWMPDSFFQNEKSAQRHHIDKPNVMIRLYRNGSILYSVRISMVLSCPMHLKNYPMDVQTCNIDMGSYAYTMNDIQYYWKEGKPIQLKAGLSQSLPSFQLIWVNVTTCDSITNTGSYSCLRAMLELKRQFSYYLLQLYIPSTMLVIVSWVSFWLDRSAVPARVTLGVTTLLTMTTQASGINAKLPPVSYTKAIDIWIGACLMFIFGALLEFAFVTYISSVNFYRTSKLDGGKASLAMNMHVPEHPLIITNGNTDGRGEVWIRQEPAGGAQMYIVGESKRVSVCNAWCWFKQIPMVRWCRLKFREVDRAKRADLYSRLLFPAVFGVFNMVYWWSYYRPDEIKMGGFAPSELDGSSPPKT